MKITLPGKVSYIIDKLMAAGFEAYAVGGCVRDSLLGREPEDWDITTSARPEQVKAMFPKTIDTGIVHGTVTVMIGREGFEVTTYRIDGEYEDGRHPKSVSFTADIIEDLKRRDFTINAMAYNDVSGIVDAFDGVGDLERGVIRCVGAAEERFGEDALRILRAVRFAAQLGFMIEAETEQAIIKLAPALGKISAERIQTEIVKLLLSDRPETWRRVYETGIAAVILPEVNELMAGEQREQILASLKFSRRDKCIRLALLLRTLGEKETRQVLRGLRFDNHTVRTVAGVARWADVEVGETLTDIREYLASTGEELFLMIMEVQRAWLMAAPEPEAVRHLERLMVLYEEVKARGDCISKKQLAISGDDLIATGIKPGKELGELIDKLFHIVLRHPEYNEKEKLLGMIGEL